MTFELMAQDLEGLVVVNNAEHETGDWRMAMEASNNRWVVYMASQVASVAALAVDTDPSVDGFGFVVKKGTVATDCVRILE